MSNAHALQVPQETYSATRLDRDLANLPLEPWPDFPPEDVLAGNPNDHSGTVFYRDPTGHYSAGLWECPVGKFKVTYPGSEFAHVVKGHATLTNVATGEAMELKVGDHFFVPAGADMIWDVHEDVRKAYTIHEGEWVDGRFY